MIKLISFSISLAKSSERWLNKIGFNQANHKEKVSNCNWVNHDHGPMEFLISISDLLSFPKSPQVQNIKISYLDFTVIVLVVRIISSSQFFITEGYKFPKASATVHV